MLLGRSRTLWAETLSRCCLFLLCCLCLPFLRTRKPLKLECFCKTSICLGAAKTSMFLFGFCRNPESSPKNGAKMFVLVADDSRVMRQIVIRTLRQAGYEWEIVEASDGQEVYDMTLDQNPDLVLSDWN